MSTAETALPPRVLQNVPEEDIYDDGFLRVEHRNYYVACAGQPIYLPRAEFMLISRLTQSVGRVVKSDDLWRAAWGESKPLNYASLHVYIYRLRTKLLPYKLQIETLVNVGYRLIIPPSEPA